MRKKIEYYKDLSSFPLWNLIQIQTSINEGRSDFRFMIIDSHINIPDKKDYDKCRDAYHNILYQMPSLDNNLLKKWKLYLAEVLRVQLKSEINKHLKLIGKRAKKIDMNRVNVSFGNYRSELEFKYKDFEFQVYSLNKNYKELWKKKYPEIQLPRILTENEDLHFFLFEEYLSLLEDYKEPEDLISRIVLITESFIENFIEVKTMKFEKILPIEKRLTKFFISINEPNKWKLIRTDLFGLNNMKYVPRSDNTMIDEVIVLRDSMNQGINLKETTFGEYQRIKVQSKAKNKAQSKKHNSA